MRASDRSRATAAVGLMAVAALICIALASCLPENAPGSTPLPETTLPTPTFPPATATVTPVPTPVIVPTSELSELLTATLPPNSLYGPLRTELVAYSPASPTGQDFKGFDAPLIAASGAGRDSDNYWGTLAFMAYTDASGIDDVWTYNLLADSPAQGLSKALDRGDPVDIDGPASWAGAQYDQLNISPDGLVMFGGAIKRQSGEFVNGIFGWDGGQLTELALAGQQTPGDDSSKTDEFYDYILGSDKSILYSSPIGHDIIWDSRIPGVGVDLLEEGDQLQDLLDGWRIPGNIKMVGSAGGDLLAYMYKMYWTAGTTEIKVDSGLWRINMENGADTGIAIAGNQINGTDYTIQRVTDVSVTGPDPYVISYIAQVKGYDDGASQEETTSGIWKRLPKTGETIRVVKGGDKITIGDDPLDQDLELGSFGPAVVDGLGRVVFGVSVFNANSDYFGLVLRGALDGHIEVLARTDKLPNSSWLKIFAPQQVTKIATNRYGVAAFVLGTGEGLWLEDVNNQPVKVVEKGDKLTVNGESKTVYFIDFVGGNNTSGRATGLADNSDVAYKVQFEDGSTAIYHATFAAK